MNTLFYFNPLSINTTEFFSVRLVFSCLLLLLIAGCDLLDTVKSDDPEPSVPPRTTFTADFYFPVTLEYNYFEGYKCTWLGDYGGEVVIETEDMKVTATTSGFYHWYSSSREPVEEGKSCGGGSVTPKFNRYFTGDLTGSKFHLVLSDYSISGSISSNNINGEIEVHYEGQDENKTTVVAGKGSYDESW